MEEIRATARLPHLDVEIAHRRLPDEDAEQLSIHLRASPSFGAMADYLQRRPWSWLAVSPLLIWQESVRAFWATWLPVPRALPSAERDGPELRTANVHPFPGPHGRNR
jgi:hypothetical protein